MPFVEVIFNLPINKAFNYKVPEHFITSLKPGQRVLAPFGHRDLTGVITRIIEKSKYADCKDIIDILDEKPLISEELIQLTQWISQYYLDYWGQTIQMALPRGLEKRSKRIVHIVDAAISDKIPMTERQKFLYDIIASDPGKSTAVYRKKYGTGAFNYLLNTLEEKNLLRIRKVGQSHGIKPLKRRFVIVSDKIEGDFKGFRKRDELQETLTGLAGHSFLLTDFQRNTGYSPAKIKRLANKSFIAIEERVVDRKTTIEYQEEKHNIVLNTEQKYALTEISKSIKDDTFWVHLLHGVTGSGKTQIYLEAIKLITEIGKTAIVLIPEISLTPQTVRRFENYFPGMVAVFHSKMTLGERYDAWMKVYHKKYSIVVGPRSALFMPLKNIGIIVVDEEHDGSYKQSGSAPRYHARDVAIYRAKIHDAIVILGSATPSLESYHNLTEKKYNLLTLSKRIKDIRLPQVEIVDMKSSYKEPRLSKILSPQLVDKIKDRLARKEQIILLQNRRGHSSFLQCITCGYIALCPHCEISLTYHYYNKHLQCHYCGYSMLAWKQCPKCQGTEIRYLGTGTQKIEKEIKRIVPEAVIIRMDLDTTKQKDSHDRLLKSFKEGKADILLGTQMIAKGLDFDNVTLVGVISADIGLTLPDYRSSERVFQLLTQVAGRAGRGILKGEVIIQSHLFSHYAIQFASNHDYLGFYNEELTYRKTMVYPPFVRMINIRFISSDLTKTIQTAREVSQKLKRFSKGVYNIIGPAPCPISKIKNRYRWQVFIKINSRIDPSSRKSKDLIIRNLDPYLRSNRQDQKIEIDVDPVDMM